MPTLTNVPSAIFREYDIRGVSGRELTPEVARAVGEAFAVLLADRQVRGPIAVGRDNRVSGPALHRALVDGLTTSGVNVVDIGEVPTPTMYWSLQRLDVAGGVQVTASHNPAEFNGFKLCIGTAALYGDDIQRLLSIIQEGRRVRGAGTIGQESIIDRYVDDVVAKIGPLARPLSIVLDGSNGVGAAPARRVLEGIGARVQCLFCESDGTFPNHLPDPSVAANLSALIGAVRGQQVDAGLAVDGDADRIGVVDTTGEIVWGDRLLVLLARDVLAHTPGAPVIFDVKCSQSLPDAIRAAGGQPVMSRTGHSLIEAKMKELNSPLAGELSGHMYIGDGWYGFDDAIYSGARVLSILARSGRDLRALLADVPVYSNTPEIRIACPDDKKFAIVERAVEYFARDHEVIRVDGARVEYGDGWGLIRASNTEPALVLRFEAKTQPRLMEIEQEMRAWLATQGVTL